MVFKLALYQLPQLALRNKNWYSRPKNQPYTDAQIKEKPQNLSIGPIIILYIRKRIKILVIHIKKKKTNKIFSKDEDYHKSICFSNLRFTNYLNLLLGTKIDTADLNINLSPMRKTKLLTKKTTTTPQINIFFKLALYQLPQLAFGNKKSYWRPKNQPFTDAQIKAGPFIIYNI